MQFGHSNRSSEGRETARRTLWRPGWRRNLFQRSRLVGSLQALRRAPVSNALQAVAEQPGALIVAVTFVLLSAVLIIGGDGIPYVMDNNETFSSLNHAQNLWSFDFFRSFGLTDEAVSPDPAAHPVVHSHQGNFPRLFAFLIYALGARSAESQIWVTTIAIGTPTVLIAYWFFARSSGALFAVIALLLLETDYLMFAQWQVNTYRVWHGFFFFSALSSVHAFSSWRRHNWAAATLALYMSLFYWELVFAVFTAICTGLYAVWMHRKSIRAIVTIGAVQALGACLGVLIVVAQLILYLGWDGFSTDIALTVTARNFAPSDPEFLQTLKTFYETKNIAFFYNLQSSDMFATPWMFTQSIFTNLLQVQTPLYSLLAISLAAASLLADSRLPGPQDVRAILSGDWVATIASMTLGCFALVLALSDNGDGVLGRPWAALQSDTVGMLFKASGCMLVSAGISVCLYRLSEAFSLSGVPPSLSRGIWAGLFMGFVGMVILTQGLMYSSSSAILWLDVLTPVGPNIARLLVLVAASTGALLILTGRRALLGKWHYVPTSLLPFLCSAGLAYVAIYLLSAGYLHSGYLHRLCPLPIFFTAIFMALGVFTCIAMSFTLAQRFHDRSHDTRFRAVAGCTSALSLAMVAFWLSVQLQYVRLLPPDQFAFFKQLKGYTAGREGILSNAYAVPFGVSAGTWAYMQSPEQSGIVPSKAAEASANPYVWLADRRHNSDYWKPATYVCLFQAPKLNVVVRALRGDSRGCSELDIVARALYDSGDVAQPDPEVVARDHVADRWAVLRLRWSPKTPIDTDD